MTITLYSKPGCQQCKLTAAVYDRAGVDIEYQDISTDPAAMERVRALGYQSVPVVETSDGDHWSGLMADKIKDSIRRVKDGVAQAA